MIDNELSINNCISITEDDVIGAYEAYEKNLYMHLNTYIAKLNELIDTAKGTLMFSDDTLDQLFIVDEMNKFAVIKYMIAIYGIDAIGINNFRKIKWRTIIKFIRKRSRLIKIQNKKNRRMYSEQDIERVLNQMNNGYDVNQFIGTMMHPSDPFGDHTTFDGLVIVSDEIDELRSVASDLRQLSQEMRIPIITAKQEDVY